MSQSQPPEAPKAPKGPKGQPSSGPNWRVFILFALAIGILLMAWKYGPGAQKAKEIDYAEFRMNYDEGRILLDPEELLADLAKEDREGRAKRLKDLNVRPQDRLTLLSADSPFSAELIGVRDISERRKLNESPEEKPFRVEVDTTLHEKEISELFSGLSVPMETVETVSVKGDSTTLSLLELRRLIARDEVFFGGEKGLRVYKVAGGQHAVIEGVEKIYPIDEQVTAEYQPFKVSINNASLPESEKAVLWRIAETKRESNTMKMVLINFLPVILIVALLFFLFRHQMKNAGKGAMNFGKSKARLLSMDKGKVTFKDVAGIHEAKEELYEIVDFLKSPKKFQRLGGNIPKGVLMVGPPGTGKTLLARAVAGEADVPFFSISGSDFVEMFVGVGASRVRDMFEQGKKNSPCIVFIDEIDAVGRHRGQGMGGGHDEREQTLNALLVEMDGFDARSGVIIIAATNRPDVLDPALLRPGRFDRQVTVALPDVKGREQILGVHAKKIKLEEGVDLNVVARGTPGFSGAELANLINEAALLAARQNKSAVTQDELEEARDKVRWGRERRSLALSDKEKENTAYHEAGHAILNVLCDHTDKLHKVTIIPRGPALGMAMFLPEEDKFSYRRFELIDQLCVAMGGRVAEEIKFGNVTNGAMGDIRQATNIARKMVCEWGMSDELGMVEYGHGDGPDSFIGMPGSPSYSEETARKIDTEIKRLIDEAYERAMSMLKDNLEMLENVSQALLEYETLDGDHIIEIMETGTMQNPPLSMEPPSPPVTPVSGDGDDKPVSESESDDEDPLAGEAVGAPA